MLVEFLKQGGDFGSIPILQVASKDNGSIGLSRDINGVFARLGCSLDFSIRPPTQTAIAFLDRLEENYKVKVNFNWQQEIS